jgi:hypothetical protein
MRTIISELIFGERAKIIVFVQFSIFAGLQVYTKIFFKESLQQKTIAYNNFFTIKYVG